MATSPIKNFNPLSLARVLPDAEDSISYDATNHRLVYHNGTRVIPVVENIEVGTFTFQGTLSIKTGVARFYIERNCTVDSIRVSANTAPTGAAVLCDVNKNGTTIYTTQGNRPTISASANTNGTATAPDVTTFAAGDYMTIDVDQVGSTIAGADLTLTVRLRST